MLEKKLKLVVTQRSKHYSHFSEYSGGRDRTFSLFLSRLMQMQYIFKYVIRYKITYLETSSERDNRIATVSFHFLPDAREVDTSLIFSYKHFL